MLNVIALMGRLVADPELRKTPNGISTTTFRIACDRNYGSGTNRETDFFDIVAWRSTAEFACKYFRKGQLVAVNGSLQARHWEDKNGHKRTSYEVVADNLHFAEGKGHGGGSLTVHKEEAEVTTYPAGSPDDFAVIDDSEDLPF